MGTAPVKTLMLSMGLPMVLSMVVQAFYNIVDSYFISNMPDAGGIVGMGEYGVNALTLAFPVQMLMIAIGVGTGVGVNALLSRSLGAGDREKASGIAGNAIFTGVCTYLVFLVGGLFGARAYVRTQTTEIIALDMGTAYLRICMTLSFGAILFMIYEKLLQSTGRTLLSTIAQIVGAVINIMLDPIMIFGAFGVPAMGIRGAAYATIIGQIASLALGVIFHHAFNKDIDTRFKYIVPQRVVIAEIYKIGVPAIIMQALMSVMTYGVNIIFGRVSEAAVTAYGIYYKIQQFVFMAAFGLNNALIPLIAFNYGMQDKQRVQAGVKYGMIYTLIVMALGAALLQAGGRAFLSAFALSPTTTSLCVGAIRVITLGYIFAGANIAFQGIFQAFGHGLHSLVVSLIRLIIVVFPVAYFFTTRQNAERLIWWTFPLAELCALIVAALFMRAITLKQR
jgi:putative MATE family efflux protein